MKAHIESETDRRISAVVTDNDGIRHRLTIDRAGTVQTYHCEAYPSGEPRSARERQRKRRSIRFAKYYVFRVRGYETIDPYGEDRLTYPERLAATALAVGAMSPETVTTLFEELYRGVNDSGDDVPVDPPPTAQNAAWTRLEQDIRLDADDDRLRSLLDASVELEALGGLRRLMDRYPERRNTDALRARLGRLFEPGAEVGHERGDSWAGVDTEGPLRVHWEHGETTANEDRRADSFDTDYLSARIQLSTTHRPIRSPAELQRRLFDHLRCQLRDCYVGMGLAPPRDLRVRGPGIAWFTHRYESADHLQRYHDPDAVIDWTALPPVPTMDG